MSEFKEGDEVWFFYSVSGRNSWPDATILYPDGMQLVSGKIVLIDEDQDLIHVYVKGQEDVVTIGFVFHHECLFGRKEEAAKALGKRLNILLEKLS